MRTIALAFALLLVTGAAQAATTFPVITTITEVNRQGFAFQPGDTFGGSATFDDADLPFTGFLALDQPGRGLTLDFADFTLEASQAEGFGDGFPALFVEEGRITGLDFTVVGLFGDFFQPLDFEGGVFGPGFQFLDPMTGETVIAGDVAVVPLPGALPLLATGLGALLWIRRARH